MNDKNNNTTLTAAHTVQDVIGCEECPLRDRYYAVCRHPDGDELDIHEEHRELPPRACPLRVQPLWLALLPTPPKSPPEEQTP